MESIPFGTMISHANFSVSPLAFFSRYFLAITFRLLPSVFLNTLLKASFSFYSAWWEVLQGLLSGSVWPALGRKLWAFGMATSWSQMARSEQMEIGTVACSSGAADWCLRSSHTRNPGLSGLWWWWGLCLHIPGREKGRDLGPCVHTSASVLCRSLVFLLALAAWNWTGHAELAKLLWMILTIWKKQPERPMPPSESCAIVVFSTAALIHHSTRNFIQNNQTIKHEWKKLTDPRLQM